MASSVVANKESEEEEAGELLFCGCTDWAFMGRSDTKKKGGATVKEDRAALYPPLPGPTRLKALIGVNISFVAAGSASSHCIALDDQGRCYTWGRNENGQLGHGDIEDRHSPTIVAALSKQKVVHAAGGRHHTTVVLSDGSAYSWGANKHGQLGTGSLKPEVERKPAKALLTNATLVACGAEFTLWLSSTPGASILSAGLPQYGQLGHGTNQEYNAKEGAVKLVYEPQPVPRAIAAIASKPVNRIACGHNHSVAADADGRVYTLGHREQKDEWAPRMVDVFQKANVLPATGVVAAGSAFSACTAAMGQLYMWGRVKPTGDNVMYPQANMDLSGWNIRRMSSGNQTSMVAADQSCISWGTAMYGELGYGATGPKSSARPKKVDALEGMHVLSVACGVGHSLIVVSRKGQEDQLAQADNKKKRMKTRKRRKKKRRRRKAKEKARVEEQETKSLLLQSEDAAMEAKLVGGGRLPEGHLRVATAASLHQLQGVAVEVEAAAASRHRQLHFHCTRLMSSLFTFDTF
eukprot:jgi/Mesen1/1707/ME000138S00570